MASTRAALTIDEFLALPETKPYAELVRGEICPKMAPGADHQDTEYNLSILFGSHPLVTGPGRTELHLRFDDPVDPSVLVPDFAYYSDRARYHRGIQDEPPDLVVEVRSPGQTLASLREKSRYYLNHGVREVWLADPRTQTIEMWRAGELEPSLAGMGEVVQFDRIALAVDAIFAFE